MLASLKNTEARSKRTASSVETTSASLVVTGGGVQQQQQPLPPLQKRIRFAGRVRPLGELLDSFQTDEHLLHALTRSTTAEDYGGPEQLIQQLLNLALVNVTATSIQAGQSRPAVEIALRALRLIASSRSPLFAASQIQTIFERCLNHAQSIAAIDSSSIFCSTLLTICAECAKHFTILQQQLISALVEILSKPDCDFLLLTESLRLLSRFFARECASRHLSRLCSICVDLLMIGDVRVRLASLDLLNEMIGHCGRNLSVISQIPIEALYKSAILSLDDCFEDIRLAGLSLVAILASLQPNLLVEDDGAIAASSKIAGNNTLANVVFGRLCHACASDRTIRVRALAALLMGKLPGVSENFIEQALDKKTIASMRVDGPDQQQQRRGGFGVAIGDYEVDAVSLISQSACGALVHALEDEFYEVREAGIESLSRMITPERLSIARQGQDFLIDALGDEVERVVLCALRALARAGAQLDFTEKHVSAILFTLKVASSAVRRQVHHTLSSILLRSRASHLACCLALLDNIRAFPADTDSIWACCACFGRNHPQLTRANLSRLLDIHPMFLSQEAKMDDPTYIAKLLIVFAAAGPDGTSSQIIRSLPEHVRSHYGYICGRFRHLLHEPHPLTGLATTYDRSDSPSTALAIRGDTTTVATESDSSSSQLLRVIVRHVELLRNSLRSSPSLERSIDLASKLMQHSVNSAGDLSTAVALSAGSSQFDFADQFTPQWRFLMGLVHCLFDFGRIRKRATGSTDTSAAQSRSILLNDLRPRIVRLLNCFVGVPPSFVAFLRLVDIAACFAVGVDDALLHRLALLVNSAFGSLPESARMPLPSVIERILLNTSATNTAGSSLTPLLTQFDECLASCLVACLSVAHERLLNQNWQMSEVRVEIREPIPLVSEPAAEVRFVSHFGATVPLRFIATGFLRDRLATAPPRIVIRVSYPNQRSDLLTPLPSEVEIIGTSENGDSDNKVDSSDNSNASSSLAVSVSMRIPIAFTASTGPCHARVSVLLSSRDDGLVDLTAVENGGNGALELLVHSKPAKGEMQKRLLSAQP